MNAPTAPDWPVCTPEAARAAGLDVAPTAAELSVMAASIVRSWGNRWAEPDDLVASTADAGAQLARTVPLILAELERVRAELAEQKRLTKHSAGKAVVLRSELATRPSCTELLTVLGHDVETVIAPLQGEARKGADMVLRAIRAMATEPTVPTAADTTPGGAS
ncbi:hypothetical protein [Streptomyces sp. NPDC001880]